jgi:signal transduction histidine kinase
MVVNTLSEILRNPGLILDSLARGIIVTDRNWRVYYANQFLVSGLGTTKEYLIGKDLMELAEEFSQKEASGELLRALGNVTSSPPTDLLTMIFPVLIPKRKFVRIIVQPYGDTQPNNGRDNSTGFLFTFADATSEGEIDEMKNDFISVASHEMRTPMTSIKGALELLLGGYAGELPAEATELLGISLTAVDRLVRLINDLLDISKIESGKMELHLDKHDVGDIVRRSMRTLRALAETHRVSIQLDQPNPLPPVLADRDRLDQIVTNLLSNALKYSPADSVVHVRVGQFANTIRVTVTDEGPGIPVDQLERVFDRFMQLQGAKKGTGLGLTICRALIEQHKGSIWVDSEPGHGASFNFDLPVAPSA